MVNFSTPTRTAPPLLCAQSVTATHLPPPNPFSPHVTPAPAHSTPPPPSDSKLLPSKQKVPSTAIDQEEYPEDEELCQFMTHIVEVPDLDEESDAPKFVIGPSASGQLTRLFSPAKRLPYVLFEDSPCPNLNLNQEYWLTFNAATAGVFISSTLLQAEMAKVPGSTCQGPFTLLEVWQVWRLGSLTGAIAPGKTISHNSVLPRVVLRPRAGPAKQSKGKSTVAKRDVIIKQVFQQVSKAPTAPVGNVFQSAAETSFAAGETATAAAGNSSQPPPGLAPPVVSVSESPYVSREHRSRVPSVSSSSGLSDVSGKCSSRTFGKDPVGFAPANSMASSPVPTPLSTPHPSEGNLPSSSQLVWVVIVGVSPALYFNPEDALRACGGVEGGRILVYNSIAEAGAVFAGAWSTGQVRTVKGRS